MRFYWICVFMPLFFSTTVYATSERSLLSRTEDASKRTTNTRVWRYNYQVIEPDPMGLSPATIRFETAEVIEKGDNLFFEDPQDRTLRETSNNWINLNGAFQSTQRRDRVRILNDLSSRETTIRYSPSANNTLVCKILGHGLYNVAENTFLSRETVRDAALTHTPTGQSDTVLADWENLHLRAELHTGGVHLNFVLQSPEEIPSIDQDQSPRHIHYVVEYELTSPTGEFSAYSNKRLLLPGSDSPPSLSTIGFGWKDGNTPECYLRPSFAFSTSSSDSPRSTFRSVLVESDRIRIIEGLPYSWLKSPKTLYPVIIDPDFYTRSGQDIQKKGETWESGKTYFISETYSIEEDQHLVIEAGAIVKINGGEDLGRTRRIYVIDGTLSVCGESYNYAILTSADDDSVGVPLDTQMNVVPGLHGGIGVLGGNDGTKYKVNSSKFNHMKITNGYYGLWLQNFFGDSKTSPVFATIRDCVFGNLKEFAINIETDNEKATPDSSWKPICVVNNLFKNPLNPASRQSDLSIWVRQVKDADAARIYVIAANNTFASENHENGPNSCIKATFEGDFDDLDSNTELTMNLNNNIFLWGESQVGLGVQLADGQSGHGADVLIMRNNNAYWGDEPFAKIIGGAENSLNLTVSEDLNAQNLPSDPFDTPSVLGEYYIKESDFYESYFKNKGIGDAGAYGLLGKTVLAPEKKEGALASNEVWARREINGSPIRDYDRVDIGYHYDPVDYTLNYLGTFPTGEVVHTDGYDLTIKPGTVVVAANDVISGRLNIDGGAFKAEGLPGEPIRWLPYTATGDGMHSPDAGDWWGLQITGDPATRTVSLFWNLVEYAWWGTSVQFEQPDPPVPVNVVIEDNVFNWNKIAIQHDGSRVNEKGVTIRNNRVLNSKWSYGISLYNSDAIVVNNTLGLAKPAEPLQSGININGNSDPTIAYNVILGQNVGIYIGDVDANPDIKENVVWDCDSDSIADPSTNPNSSSWTSPITENPCYVSSDERGFRDESEHYFLPQLDGDASRLPWIVSDLDDQTGVAVDGIAVSSGGSIEVYAVNSNLTPELKGYYVPAGYSEQYVSTNDMTDTAAIRFVGPMTFGGTPSLILKTIQGSEMKVAIPTDWKNSGIAADENWVFWIALDGSLYYARKDHSMEDVQVTPPDGWNMTAIYAMQYHEAPSGDGDLDDLYPNGLAVSAFDSFGADPSISSAYQSVSPDYNVVPYTYHGTKSKFHRIGGQISVPAPAPFSDLDMGYHPFRGRTWVRNDESIQISWDPPHEHPFATDHYKAALYRGEVEIEYDEVQEDEPIDARDLNGDVPLDEIGPDDEDPYEIRLSPVDENENEGPESIVRFGVDRTPPKGGLSGLTVAPSNFASSISLDPSNSTVYYMSTEDFSSLTQLEVTIDPGLMGDEVSGFWKIIELSPSGQEVYTDADDAFEVDFADNLNDGDSDNDIAVRAYDLAGNPNLLLKPDDADPILDVDLSIVNDVTLVGPIRVEDEGSGLRKIQLLVDVPTYTSPLVVLEWDSNLGREFDYNSSWGIDHLPPTSRWVEEEVQDYKIYVRAWDNVGNMGESSKVSFEVPDDDPEGEPIYVDGSNTGTEDGTSWQTAFNTIQEALGVASNGDRIFVAEGVYEENLLVQKRVKIYGGFAGLNHPVLALIPEEEREIEAADRHIVESNRTILEPADQDSSVITNDVNSHFALFDGLVIRGGKAESSHGGAVKCVSFSPTFVNCVFANNRTDHQGGAVYCDYSFPQFVHCTFASNVADSNGGAIACRNRSKPDLRNCIVWGNETTGGQGDEIFVDETSEANVNYSCVREGWNSGVGNIDGDPKFVNPEEDWRLRHDTSCANAGDPVSEIDRDILGDPRVADDPETEGFDLGAYELEKRLTGSTGVTVWASSKLSSDYSEDFLLQGEALGEYQGGELGKSSGWVSDFKYWGDPSPSKDYFDMDPTLWFDLGRVHRVSAINLWNFVHSSFIDAGISNVRISHSIDGVDYQVLEPEEGYQGSPDRDENPRFAVARGAEKTSIPLNVEARFFRFDHTSPHNVCLDCSEVDCQACCSVMADCDCVPYDPDPECDDCQVPCDGGNCSDDPACEQEVCSTCSPPCTAPGSCNDDGGCGDGCTAFICEDYGTCPASKHPLEPRQNLGHTRSLGEVQFVGYPLEDYDTISSVAVDFSGTSLPIYATPLPSYPALTETPTPININLVRNLLNASQSNHLGSTELDEMWRSGVDSGNTLTFFLDGHYLIDKIVLWNFNPPNADVGYGVKSLDVAVAIDPEFTGTPTFLPIPTAAATPETPTPIPTGFGNSHNPAIPLLLPQPYPMKAKFVRFQNMVNHYDVSAGGFSEIQFLGRRIAVPVEVTLWSTPVPELTDAILAEEFSSTSSADMWTGDLNDEIEFDFGKTMSLRSVHLWNWNDPGSLSKGARTIAIFKDGSMEPSLRVSLAQAPGSSPYRGESFELRESSELGGFTATKVRLRMESNHGGDDVGLSEAVFLGEMEYSTKILTEVTTASFRSAEERLHVDQFEFEPTPTYNLTDRYVEKFKDMNDRWEWRAPHSLISPAAGYRSAVWYPTEDNVYESFMPSLTEACASPPAHHYASYGDNADITERLDSRTPYPTVPPGTPTPIPNPQSTVPAYWYLPATPPATPEYNPRFPFEFRPWGDSPGVLFEAAATATPMAVSDDGHSFWLRMQDGEACAPEAIKSGWNATAGKGNYFDASNMPFLGKVPWSHWLVLRDFAGTNNPAKISYGWHILRADFSNLSGVSQNFSIFEGLGFQTQFEFLAGDRGTSRVGTTVYANDRPITEQGEVVGVSRPPKAARMGRIEGDDKGTDLTKGYHLYRMFISRQEVRMYIDDNLIVDWRGHGMSRDHSVLPPYIQFNVHGWRYSNGRNFWVDDQTYVEALELPSDVVGDFALSDGDDGYDGSKVDPDFKIDYYLHIPLGVDPDEVYRVDR